MVVSWCIVTFCSVKDDVSKHFCHMKYREQYYLPVSALDTHFQSVNVSLRAPIHVFVVDFSDITCKELIQELMNVQYCVYCN